MTRWWRALDPKLRPLIVLTLLGLLVVTAAWWLDERGRYDVGRIESSADGSFNPATLARTAWFEVPEGRISVGFEGQPSLDPFEDGAMRAPRGGLVVRATWSTPEPSTAEDGPSEKSPTIKVWLRSGDERWLLFDDVRLRSAGAVLPDERTALAGVPTDDPRELVAELEFAGKRQSVNLGTGRREVGAFGPLYRPGATDDLPAHDRRDVGSHRTVDPDGAEWNSTWRPRIQRLPYVPGLGWAEPGREWLVLGSGPLDVDGASTGTTKDAPSTVPATVVARDGRLVRKPHSAVAVDGRLDLEYDPAGAVFEVPAGRSNAVTVSLRMPGSVDAEPSTFTRTLRLHDVAEPGADS